MYVVHNKKNVVVVVVVVAVIYIYIYSVVA